MRFRSTLCALLVTLPCLGGCASTLGFAIALADQKETPRSVWVEVASIDSLIAGELVELQFTEERPRQVFHFSYIDRRSGEIVGHFGDGLVRVEFGRVRSIRAARVEFVQENRGTKWVALTMGAAIDALLLLHWAIADFSLD